MYMYNTKKLTILLHSKLKSSLEETKLNLDRCRMHSAVLTDSWIQKKSTAKPLVTLTVVLHISTNRSVQSRLIRVSTLTENS